MNLRAVVRFFALCLVPTLTNAQSNRRVDDEASAWIAFVGVHPLSPVWRLQLETQLRQTEGAQQPQQRLFRTAVLRQMNSAVRVGAGYAFTRAYPPEEFVTSPQPANEHRSYLQFDLQHAAGRAHWDHRYRLEQRWVERLRSPTAEAGWTYTNRARYFSRAFVAPGGGAPGDGEAYFTAYDEIFVNFGRNVRNNVFDQNRLFVGGGYRWSRALSIEVGYLNQLIVRSTGTDVERNHTLLVGFFSSAPLRRF